ncbi:hypothetical protein ABT096_29555 [Streptomyces sp. NPDC002561]|uniref:hypothetical protein n=1 Tax=Streptomyces sp. NPDC002561 TaxID=3154418 RepID=UPI00332434B6
MTEHTIRCTGDPADNLTAHRDGDDVALYARHGDELKVSVYVPFDKARTFARGILALADEIDGGGTLEPPALKEGDRVRITSDDFPANVGKVGFLERIDDDDTVWTYRVRTDHAVVPVWVRSVERLDAAVGDESTPAVPDRADLLSRARDLMHGQTYTAVDLIALAEHLAG